MILPYYYGRGARISMDSGIGKWSDPATVEARKLEYDLPMILKPKERRNIRHESPYIHFSTFWNLLYQVPSRGSWPPPCPQRGQSVGRGPRSPPQRKGPGQADSPVAQSAIGGEGRYSKQCCCFGT